MRSSTLEAYVQDADLVGRARYRERAKQATQAQTQSIYSTEQIKRLGITNLLIGRYASVEHPSVIYWATAPDGRRFWMFGGMYRVWLAVEARLKADRDLKVGDIAMATELSRGYVSKVLRKLQQFGFIQILGVFRGRWGRVIAKLRNVSSLVRKQGGNIDRRSVWQRHHDDKLAARRESRYEDPWGSWRRSLERTLYAKEHGALGTQLGTDQATDIGA